MVIKNFNDALIEFRKIQKELDSINESMGLLSNQIEAVEEEVENIEVGEGGNGDTDTGDGGSGGGGDTGTIIYVNGEIVE